MNDLIKLWISETQLHESETQEMVYFKDQMIDFASWMIHRQTPRIRIAEANKSLLASNQTILARVNQYQKQIDDQSK